jgi:hypothetical protein
MTSACELRRGLGACGSPVVAVCQYCGSSFCEAHGVRLPDGQEVCSRSTCDKKRRDMLAFEEYKAAAGERNTAGSCGQPGCSLRPTSECAKCHAGFCDPHLRHREIEEYRAGRTTPRLASLCRFCDKRRGLWKKR